MAAAMIGLDFGESVNGEGWYDPIFEYLPLGSVERIESSHIQVVHLAYRYTNALLYVTERLTSLPEDDQDAIYAPQSYWNFLAIFLFWLEKGLESIVMRRVEMDNCFDLRIASGSDMGEGRLNDIHTPMGFVIDTLCWMGTNRVDLDDLCVFIREKQPDAEAILRFLRRDINAYANDVQSNSRENDFYQWEGDPQQVSKSRLSLFTNFSRDKKKILQALEDVAHNFAKIFTEMAKQACETDRGDIKTFRSRKSTFFISENI
jgi:hypothetical protein